MVIATVNFVYSDEATPQDIHTRRVKAADIEDAKATVQANAFLAGDRIEILGVMTDSWT